MYAFKIIKIGVKIYNFAIDSWGQYYENIQFMDEESSRLVALQK